jgi:hypothetical protein
LRIEQHLETLVANRDRFHKPGGNDGKSETARDDRGRTR